MNTRAIFSRPLRAFVFLGLTFSCSAGFLPAAAQEITTTDRLVAAYPGIIKGVSANAVVFADGSALPFDDGKGVKPFEQWLESPDIEDMFAQAYVKGPVPQPAPGQDPGRARNEAFFLKVYGDCRKAEVASRLVDVVWLPKKMRQVLKVSPVNGMAERLRAVSAELDALPAEYDRHLKTPVSTYNCRVIDGTGRLSAHAFGIAIDMAVRRDGYWRWQRDEVQSANHTKALPFGIVDVFEKHGFIWGGKWHHFDTMHFEYRPELIAPETVLGGDVPKDGDGNPASPH
jgi:hypothetical protein